MSEIKTYEFEVHALTVRKVILKSTSPEDAVRIIKSNNHDGTEWRDVAHYSRVVSGNILESIKIEDDIFDKKIEDENIL